MLHGPRERKSPAAHRHPGAGNALPTPGHCWYTAYKGGAGMGVTSRAPYAVLTSRSLAAQCWQRCTILPGSRLDNHVSTSWVGEQCKLRNALMPKILGEPNKQASNYDVWHEVIHFLCSAQAVQKASVHISEGGTEKLLALTVPVPWQRVSIGSRAMHPLVVPVISQCRNLHENHLSQPRERCW